MNDIYEMMSTLRAVRRLRPDPIPDDVPVSYTHLTLPTIYSV